MTKRFLVEAAPELGGQLSPQRGDNSFAIFGTFEFENVTPDALADMPTKCDETSINSAGDCLASCKNHLPYVAEQIARKCGAGL
jgi:hypothetical protein